MENFNLIQQITGIGFVSALVLFFIFSFYKRRKIALGNFLTTLVPASIFVYVALTLESKFIVMDRSLQFAGPALIALGSVLSAVSIKYLGCINSDDFWLSRKKEKNRTLVISGPYKYIRHPIALAIIITYGGLTLTFLHPVTIFIYLVSFLAVVYTSLAEEKFIQSKFPEYKNYKNRTGMFLPKL